MSVSLKEQLKKQASILGLTVLFGSGLSCLFGSYVLESLMGHLTIEQILFHVVTPMKGVSPEISEVMSSFIFWMVFWSVMFWLVCSGLAGRLAGRFLPGCRLCSRPRLRWCILAVCLLWTVALAYVFVNHDVGQFAGNLLHPSRMIDEHYSEPRLSDFRAPARRRNLVLVISESLERTYENQRLFGENLLRELTELEAGGRCFRGQIEVNGTDNTIASISAILYGIPRLLVGMEGWHNYIEGNMFSHCTPILKVLHEHGYGIWHVQGGSLDFASTRSLFEEFPDAHLTDESDLCEDAEYRRLAERGQAYGWGVNDRIMLKAARRQLEEASRSGHPFVMSISTIDSHYDGYLEPGEETRFCDYRDVVRSQSRLLADFVRWIQAQPFGADTMIVVVGDHYVMRDEVGPCLVSALSNGTGEGSVKGAVPERTVYSCIWNDGFGVTGSSDRQFCSFDWAPTLLEGLGFRWPSHRYGLGVSLYSGLPTLLEQLGGPCYETESRRRSATYGRILSGAAR